MFIISLLIFLGGLCWFYFEPGWEPGLFILSSFSVVIFSESHVKKFIKEKYMRLKSHNIKISKGEVLLSDEQLMRIIRPLCLGEDVKFFISNLEGDSLEKYAKRKVKNEDEKYHLLAQVNRGKNTVILCMEGIKLIALLYKKELIRCNVGMLSSIARNYIFLVYSLSHSGYRRDCMEYTFDVYSSSIIDGQIYFSASIPDFEIKKILEKIGVTSTQEMCQPYMYCILELPEDILLKYIVPAHIFHGLIRFSDDIENDNFWAQHNWYIGPH